MMVLWCTVDDVKASHADSKVVHDTLNTLKEEQNKGSTLAVTQGKVHKCLEMTIDGWTQ